MVFCAKVGEGGVWCNTAEYISHSDELCFFLIIDSTYQFIHVRQIEQRGVSLITFISSLVTIDPFLVVKEVTVVVI